ncbi:MAG TPA: hypothetical protein VNB23_02660 [Ramlibacter sp.]|nr:hypothetical protein [Ramlibacter sp.]
MNDTHPLDSTRKMASEALERASSSMKDLRSGMSERASAASRYMGDYARTGKDYVAEHPLKSALVAAAVGAAVAGIVIALRHRRDNDRYF